MGNRVHEIEIKLASSDELDPCNISSEAFRVLNAIKKHGAKITVEPGTKIFENVFPGYSVQAYNQLIPSLLQKGWLVLSHVSPRDGDILKLTEKSNDLFQ